MDGYIRRRIYIGRNGGRVPGWMDMWMKGWVDGWVNGRMEERIDPHFQAMQTPKLASTQLIEFRTWWKALLWWIKVGKEIFPIYAAPHVTQLERRWTIYDDLICGGLPWRFKVGFEQITLTTPSHLRMQEGINHWIKKSKFIWNWPNCFEALKMSNKMTSLN